MKKILVLVIAAAFCAFAAAGVAGQKAAKKSGEELFKSNCAACHPDGGNIVNPKKTLHQADREANKIKKSPDIIAKMRKPGPGMTQFDKSDISDQDAKKIADYIIKTFK